MGLFCPVFGKPNLCQRLLSVLLIIDVLISNVHMTKRRQVVKQKAEAVHTPPTAGNSPVSPASDQAVPP